MHMTQVQSLGGASDWEKGFLDQANTLFNNVKRVSSFGRTQGAKSLKQASAISLIFLRSFEIISLWQSERSLS